MLSAILSGPGADNSVGNQRIPWLQRDRVALNQFHVAQKQAADKLETSNFIAYNSKTPFSWLNIALVHEALSESDTRSMLEILKSFFGNYAWTLFTANEEFAKTCLSMKQASAPEKPLMAALEVDGMILDLNNSPDAFKPPQFPGNHVASQLRVELVKERSTLEDYVKLVFEVFLQTVPTEENFKQTVESYMSIKRDHDPKYISFVGYEGNTSAATGSVVLRPETGTACIIEIITGNDFRGKGYGAVIFAKCVETAVMAGYKYLVLTASEEGKPVYARQGFKTVEGGPIYMFDVSI